MSIKDWVDLNDNRLGPILRDLADAAENTTGDETLRQLANRLKFMAGAVHSHRSRVVKNEDQMDRLMSQLAQQAETIDQLLDALHDAICRPKGVIPESADQFYDSRRAGIANMIYEAKVKAGREK